MGVDAVVSVRMKSGECWKPAGFCCYRYWSPNYRRGDWIEIMRGIVSFIEREDVEAVYYCGDHDDEHTSEEHRVTPEMLAEYTRAYVESKWRAGRQAERKSGDPISRGRG